MPHLIFECSEELKSRISFEPIFLALHTKLSELLPTQISSCKSRVITSQDYLVGDKENNLFIHLTIKILSGRTNEIKQQAGEKILTYLKEIVQELSIIDVSISVEILDLSQNYYKT